MGDVYINIVNSNNCSVRNFLNICYSHSFFPTINKQTRVTYTTASLTDHNWTNNLADYLSSGLIHTSISDHFPVISYFGQRMTTHCFTSFEKRIFSEESLNNFKIAMSSYY